MPLPSLIEIVPPLVTGAVRLTVPGSKSVTNRALILAALGSGRTVLRGALWSEDTRVMVDCLRTLGLEVAVRESAGEAANRTIEVAGCGGRPPGGGTWERPTDLFVGNAGTAARFLAALVALGEGVYRLRGVPRMHERPQEGLFSALRQLGCEIRCDAAADKLPARIRPPVARAGVPEGPRSCQVSLRDSSQFASALLLCARHGGWEVGLIGEELEEAAYVRMTRELLAVFPAGGGEFAIEADASSGTYFLAADWLLRRGVADGGPVEVSNWPCSGWQIDQRFPATLDLWGTPGVSSIDPGGEISRRTDLGDGIMTAVAMAPFAGQVVRFTDLGRLRLQECERVAALRTELTRCGVRVEEEGDTLIVFPSVPHGAEIETYHDHRMAMCFAVLGLRVPGMRLRDPGCVNKTFPNFFQKLAAPPPDGLGATILDARDWRPLQGAELLAG